MRVHEFTGKVTDIRRMKDAIERCMEQLRSCTFDPADNRFAEILNEIQQVNNFYACFFKVSLVVSFFFFDCTGEWRTDFVLLSYISIKFECVEHLALYHFFFSFLFKKNLYFDWYSFQILQGLSTTNVPNIALWFQGIHSDLELLLAKRLEAALMVWTGTFRSLSPSHAHENDTRNRDFSSDSPSNVIVHIEPLIVQILLAVSCFLIISLSLSFLCVCILSFSCLLVCLFKNRRKMILNELVEFVVEKSFLGGRVYFILLYSDPFFW